jgi:transcriptional antiterminator NusG
MENILSKMGMGEAKVVVNIDVEVGEVIKIKSGSFENYAAKVVSVDNEKGKVKALIDMFGRETPVELDFDQVEKS